MQSSYKAAGLNLEKFGFFVKWKKKKNMLIFLNMRCQN